VNGASRAGLCGDRAAPGGSWDDLHRLKDRLMQEDFGQGALVWEAVKP
jgi:hypothetical protein